MIKQLTGYLNYSFFAEVSLLLFAIIFVAVVVHTLLLRNEDSDRQARIVLDDKSEDYS